MIFKLQKKHIGRLQFTLLNITNNLLPLFGNVFISFLTVRLTGVELWGAYSKLLLFIMLSAQVLAWGNKEFLLREFSLHPAQITVNWKKTFSSRNLLLPPVIILLFFFIPDIQQCLLTCLILFARYICYSYEVIILYQRRFLVRILSEVVGSLLICISILLYNRDITLQQLLFITCIAEIIKTIVLVFYFGRKFYPSFTAKPSLEVLKKALPFFLLAFSGLLLSRVDQLIVAAVLPLKSFGFYQVYMNFLLLIQSFANLTFQPVLKMIYRSPVSIIPKTARSLFLFGLIFSLGCIVLLRSVLQIFYGFPVTLNMLIAGWIFMLAPYLYLPYAYYFSKINKLRYILVANLAGVIFTLIAIGFVSGRVPDLLFAILCIAALIQWLITIAYIILFKKNIRLPVSA